MDRKGILCADLDECDFCHGYNGGTAGNEVIVHGLTLCDYCHATLLDILLADRKEHSKHLDAQEQRIKETLETLVQYAPQPVTLRVDKPAQ